MLGEEVYGNYFALVNFAMIFAVFLDVGINNYNNREISRNPEKLSAYFNSIIQVKFFISILYFTGVSFVALIMGYSLEQIGLLMLILFNQILISFVLYFRSNIGALQLFKTDSFMSAIDKVFMILVAAFFIWGAFVKFSIWYFVLAQTIAYFFAGVIGFYLVFKRTNQFKFEKDKSLFIKILKESYPFALLVLMMGLYTRLDAVMLERMLVNGKEEAGIYAASFRLLDAVSQFGVLSAAIFLPVFSKMIKQKKSPWKVANLIGFLALLASVVLAGLCWTFKSEIMSYLYIDGDFYYAQIFGWLMFSFIGISSVYVFGTLLTANGSLKALNLIAVSGVLINIVLNFMLIPQYQAMGATIATVFTQSLVALVHYIVAWRIMR